MNQKPTIGAPKPAVSKWLWIVLIVVGLGAAGYFGWYYLMGPGKKVETSTTTSTTTPASTTTTPSSTSTTSDTTPSTSTSPDTTATTSTPPTGWKTVTGTAVSTGSTNVKFSVYIKNDWEKYNENDTGHGPVFFTNNSKCSTGSVSNNYTNCWDYLAVSYSSLSSNPEATNLTTKNYPYPDGTGNAYVGVNKSLSTSDQ